MTGMSDEQIEKTFDDAVRSIASDIAAMVESDVGVPASETFEPIVEALHEDRELPTEDEVRLLVYGADSGPDEGVVPPNVAKAHPALDAILDSFTT